MPSQPIDLPASMASTMPKQLGELLQEQQEPFILEVYLLERGYVRNKSNSHSSFRCCSGTSGSFLKRSASWDSNERKKVIPNCSKIVRAVFNKLVSISNNHRMNNSSVTGDGNSSVREIGSSKQEQAESDGFSSASSTTVFNSCSDIEDGPNDGTSTTADTCRAFKLGNLLQEKEVVTDRKLQWRCGEDNKQLSPVSVLEEIASNEGSPVHNNRQRKTKTRDSIVAIPFCNFIVQSSMKEPSCTDPSSQHLTAKRVLQQSKQLLFDCVKEMVETRVQDRRRQHFLGPEELGKVLCEDMRRWSKLSGNETNTTQLLNWDFTASFAEWSDFEPQLREIGTEIGDAVLEDMISKEIVVDMIELVAPHLCQAT